MDEATVALTITSLAVFAVFVGLFIWGLATGQFKDIEEPKYRMLDMDDQTVKAGNNTLESDETTKKAEKIPSKKEGEDENGCIT